MFQGQIDLDTATPVDASAIPDVLFERGLYWASGRSGVVNLVAAHKWFNLAALKGRNDAIALRREAVLAEVVKAEQIDPTEEQVLEMIAPAAEREGIEPEKLLEQLREGGRLERVRDDVATSLAVDLLVKDAKPISVEQAKARQKLWTPGQEGKQQGSGSGQLWTPGS